MIAAGWSHQKWVRASAKPKVVIPDWVHVERRDLNTALLAGGDLQPVKQATVKCQVEDITDSGGVVVLSVIANGAQVKKGNVLCKLDSAEIEEMARAEEAEVNQARALGVQARLNLEAAKLALREYQEGLITQLNKEFAGRIALGRSDTQRQTDRVAWAEVMATKGYLSEGQLLTERQTLAKALHELRKTEGELRLFREFQVPKELKRLQGEIESAEINSRLTADVLKAREEILAYYRDQIEKCTVKAPQDGVVVYANGSRWRPRPLESGVKVFEDQTLFILPDLAHMQVEVAVHETMAPRVKVGMKANVRIASTGDRQWPGRVVSIEMLPFLNWKEDDEKIRQFTVRVRLDKKPSSAMPFMSAAVEFDTGRIPDALVIPSGALAVADGRQFCYVIEGDVLERRPITTRHATTEFLEVTGGLLKGERVVARSRDVDQATKIESIRDSVANLPVNLTLGESHELPR
jgi:HlyD family secretion protein